MARGWESKSVEAQQSDDYRSGRGPKPSPEELEKGRKRESLELSRTRVTRELAGARSEVHRTALENALRFLDEEIARV